MASYRYGLSAKFTLDQHSAIVEFANKRTNSNYSHALRKLVELGLEAMDKGNLSAGEKLAIADWKRGQKKQKLTRLRQGYISLQEDYDKDYESSLIEFAKDSVLSYPPNVEDMTIIDTDMTLHKTLFAVKRSCDGSGHTSLRDVYRRANDTKETIIGHLEELRRLGYVDFDDPAYNSSCQVTLLKS